MTTSTDSTVNFKKLQSENNTFRSQLSDLNNELIDLRQDNEKYREKIQDLEKWINLLLNNFYSGNPQSLENIQSGLEIIDVVRNQNFQLKRSLLYEKKKYNDLQEDYMSQKKKSKEREEDFKKSQVGELILQRQALEENLRHLSDEVETLSHKNQRLLKDLKVKDFYQQYNQLREELETMQKAHATLISTLQPDKFAKKSIRDPNQLSKQTPNNSHSTDQPKRLLDSQRQYHGDHHGYHNQSQQRQNSSSGSSVDAILKFFSCNGCGIGPNSTGLNHASNFNINHSIIDRSNYQYYIWVQLLDLMEKEATKNQIQNKQTSSIKKVCRLQEAEAKTPVNLCPVAATLVTLIISLSEYNYSSRNIQYLQCMSLI